MRERTTGGKRPSISTWSVAPTLSNPVEGRALGAEGMSGLVILVGLVVVAVLVLISAKALLANSSTGPSSSTGQAIVQADSIQAQQALSTALSTVQNQVTAGGGSSGDLVGALQAAEPSITFSEAPSTKASVVAVTAGPQVSGSVGLAARSSDGTCWFIWWAPTATAWFGQQSGQASCPAPVLAAAPTPQPVGGTGVTWRSGGFPVG